MNPSTRDNLRNAAIVVAIALAVWLLPGGGDAADFVGALLFLAIVTSFVLIAARFYRENRVAIFALGDKHRALLYGALGAAVVAMAARERLFDTGGGILLWLAVLVGASFALYTVWRHHRSYEY